MLPNNMRAAQARLENAAPGFQVTFRYEKDELKYLGAINRPTGKTYHTPLTDLKGKNIENALSHLLEMIKAEDVVEELKLLGAPDNLSIEAAEEVFDEIIKPAIDEIEKLRAFAAEAMRARFQLEAEIASLTQKLKQ
jgi:hypothetical protein